MKVFISHSSKDKNFVTKLKKDLNDNQIDTWFDKDEMFPGDDLMEKLIDGLDKSTHFLIILSPSSIESEWVQLELRNALNQIQEETLEKIIPIRYRDCEIPKSLERLLFVDLSEETVFTKNGEFEIFGNKYPEELHRLVRTIKQSQKRLTVKEKEEITGQNIATNKNFSNPDKLEFYFSVVGYSSISRFLATYIPEEIRDSYRKKPLDQFQPIVLPKAIKNYFKDLKFGDKIKMIDDKGNLTNLDFAKFSSNNARIAIPAAARKQLHISINNTYKMEFNFKNNSIKFLKINDK